MALLRLTMQSSAYTSRTDSSFHRPLERNQTHVGSSLPLRVLEKVMSEPTLIEYTDSEKKKAAPHWLSPNYVDLHMRSARVVSCEAMNALQRHFEQPRKISNRKKTEDEAGAAAMVDDAFMWRPDSLFELSGEISDLMRGDERSFLEESFC